MNLNQFEDLFYATSIPDTFPTVSKNVGDRTEYYHDDIETVSDTVQEGLMNLIGIELKRR